MSTVLSSSQREASPTPRVFSIIAGHWRELARFAVLFRFFESLLFAPVAALIGKWLVGATVLDSTAIISFLVSPRGLLAVAFAAITALTIRLLEHAGLSVIFFGALHDQRVSARQALRFLRGQLPEFVRVSARFSGIGLLTVMPLVLVAGGLASWLLSRHDVNYYLKLRPPEFVMAAGLIAAVGVATAVVLVALIVRWRWVVQVMLFERKKPRAAFSESAALTRGIRRKLASVLVLVLLISAFLGLLASIFGSVCTSLVLLLLGDGAVSLALAFGVLLMLRIIIGAVCTFFGSCLDAGVFTSLYHRRSTELSGPMTVPALENIGVAPRWWLPAAVAVALLLMSGIGVWMSIHALWDQRSISIHAHRGVSTKAPENTLPAIREAIAAGADYLETDVQLSKDGVLVIAHDSDFSRLGGVAKKVWELTYEEIRAIPLGGTSAPEYRNEVTPTLDQLLAEAKGRIKVNIELKYYGDHQPHLARKVVEAVRAHGMLDQIVVQCLEYEPLLEVRRLAPRVSVGYLLSFNAREPGRLNVDFLSVEKGRLDRNFISGAHRRGQQVYAWTVNTSEDMQRLLNLGVDGLITDESALARRTVDGYMSQPKPERAIARVKAWLAD